MIELDNQSGWSAGLYPGWSRQGLRQQTLVVKIGFRFDTSGKLTPEPLPIIENDEYRGDPGKSSLQAATEIMPFKQGGELYLSGTVHPEESAPGSVQVAVGLRHQNNQYWSKELRVFGSRHWERKLLTRLPSLPQPISEPVPLIYENAYGGNDPQNPEQLYQLNPSGCGYSLRGLRSIGLQLPQLEMGPHFISSPASQVQPAGFGPLPPHWSPRAELKVMINEEAITNGTCPFSDKLPENFYNYAPPDQRFGTPFLGPLTLKLSGLVSHAHKELLIEVPETAPKARLQIKGQTDTMETNCDTLIIDSDARTLALLYRGSVITDPNPDPAGWITLSDPDIQDQSESPMDDQNIEGAA